MIRVGLKKNSIKYLSLFTKRFIGQPLGFDPDVDYYSILGLKSNASQKEIKENYYKLAKKYHPDINKSVESGKFKDITNAYNILSDSGLKNKYDSMRIGPFSTYRKNKDNNWKWQSNQQDNYNWGSQFKENPYSQRRYEYKEEKYYYGNQKDYEDFLKDFSNFMKSNFNNYTQKNQGFPKFKWNFANIGNNWKPKNDKYENPEYVDLSKIGLEQLKATFHKFMANQGYKSEVLSFRIAYQI